MAVSRQGAAADAEWEADDLDDANAEANYAGSGRRPAGVPAYYEDAQPRSALRSAAGRSRGIRARTGRTPRLRRSTKSGPHVDEVEESHPPRRRPPTRAVEAASRLLSARCRPAPATKTTSHPDANRHPAHPVFAGKLAHDHAQRPSRCWPGGRSARCGDGSPFRPRRRRVADPQQRRYRLADRYITLRAGDFLSTQQVAGDLILSMCTTRHDFERDPPPGIRLVQSLDLCPSRGVARR